MKIRCTKLFFTLIISVVSIAHCEAQYATGVGLRAGKLGIGFDIKHFFDAPRTVGIEFFAGYTQEANSGYLAKLFVVKQKSIHQSRLQIPTKVIFGVGPHVGYFRDPYYKLEGDQTVYYPMNTFSVGMDAMFGFEYNSRKLPFTIGIDATPYYTFINPGPEWIDFSVNVRYIFRTSRR